MLSRWLSFLALAVVAVLPDVANAAPNGKNRGRVFIEPNLESATGFPYLARGTGMGVYFGHAEVAFVVRRPGAEEAGSDDRQTLRMSFPGSQSAEITAGGTSAGKSNYFLGSDPAKWRRDVPRLASLHYRGLYPGVDATFYTNAADRLELDFIVEPGIDPGQIRLSFEDADRVELVRKTGDLLVMLSGQEVLRQHRPIAFQQQPDGRRTVVPVEFVVSGRDVSFWVGTYDTGRTLTIDPEITHSTYLGGRSAGYNSRDYVHGVASDESGNAYVAGMTTGIDFPLEKPFQAAKNGFYSGFITKFGPDGQPIYSTYLGGDTTTLRGITVDADQNVYVVGNGAADYPVTGDAYMSQVPEDPDGWLAVFTKMNSSGNALVYSSYFGGTKGAWYYLDDYAHNVALDGSGNVYIVGEASTRDFNRVPATHPLGYVGFLMKLEKSGTGYQPGFSTYVAGPAESSVYGVAATDDGTVYVTGWTETAGLATADGAGPGSVGGFLAKYGPDGTGPLYFNYAGSSPNDMLTNVVALDNGGLVYATGNVSQRAWIARYDLATDGAGKVVFANALPAGGSSALASGLALDASRNVYVAGSVAAGTLTWPDPSTTLFIESDGTRTYDGAVQHGRRDVFYARFTGDGLAKGAPATHFGFLGGAEDDSVSGIAVSSAGVAVLGGWTRSMNFPVVNPIPQGTTNRHVYTGWVTRIAAPMEDEKIVILTSTTRWKAQKDETKDIEIKFSSSKPLKKAVVTLTPVGTASQVPPITVNFDPATPPNPYVVAWNGRVTASDRNSFYKAGDYTISIVGTPEVGDPIPSAADDPNDTVSLVEVKEVKFQEIQNGAALDTNRGVGGGKMIFSESKIKPTASNPNPDPQAEVDVIISTNPVITALRGQAPVKVFVKSIDVDDPSASAAPVDDETKVCLPANCDNQGTVKAGELKQGTSWINGSGGVDGTVAADGTFKAMFRTSLRHGDNYRLAGSTSQTWLTQLDPVRSNNTGAVVHPSGKPVAELMSPMLTVWRHLHLEMDAFNTSGASQIGMDLLGPYRHVAPFAVVARNTYPFVDFRHTSAAGQWVGSRVNLCPTTPKEAAVERSSAQVITTSQADGNLRPTVCGPAYDLRDDLLSEYEAVTADLYANRGGHLQLLTDTLRAVYIEVDPVLLPRTTPLTPLRNLTGVDQRDALTRVTTASPNYWYLPLHHAFNAQTAADLDPSTDFFLLGRYSGAGNQLNVAVFHELIRDFYDPLTQKEVLATLARILPNHKPASYSDIVSRQEAIAFTIAHEVLHTLALTHDGTHAGALMCLEGLLTKETNRNKITADQMAAIRGILLPRESARPSASCSLP